MFSPRLASPVAPTVPAGSSTPADSESTRVEMPLASDRVLRWQVAAIGLLTAANAARLVSIYVFNHPRLHGLIALVDVDGEGNLPSTYSGVVLVLAALLLAVVWRRDARQRRPGAWHWLLLACGFGYLAADELIQLHELTMAPIQEHLHTSGVFHFGWLVLAVILLPILGIAFVPFVLRLPRPIFALSVASAGLYLGGAVGLEMLGGVVAERLGEPSLLYQITVAAEEFLEMCGVAVWIYTLLRYLSVTSNGRHLRVQFFA